MFIDGSYSVLYIKHDGVFLPIGCLTSNSFSEETESLDSTTRDNNGWKTNRLTNQSYNISFEGIDIGDYTSTTLFTLHRLTEIKRNRQLVEWKIQGKDENYEYGVGFITSLSNDSSVDELSSFSGEIVGYGSPYDYLEKIIKDYENRIIADGGTIEALDCLRKSIEEIINKEKKPKLALIPSGYKVNKVYSVLPSDGVGDFDFSRSGSATRINKDGLIETVSSNVPRLNYPLIDGVVSGCPSLLLEPASTNQVPYSEDINNNAWTKLKLNVSPNETISPDGTLSADKLTEDTTTGQHRISDIVSLVSGEDYTISAFIKPNGSRWVRLRLENAGVGSGQINVWFDIENGVVGTEGAGVGKIEKYPNGWYKCSATGATNTVVNVCIVSLADADGSSSYAGSTSRSAYVWGVSVENLSHLTSYIKTEGSAVTRSAETASGSGDAATFNDSEGVLMAEIAWINNDLDVNGDVCLSDNSASNRVLITQTTTKNQIEMFFRGTGATISQFFTLNDTSNFNKFAIKYKSTDFAFYINGFKLFESDSVATVSNLFELSFDNPSGGGTRNLYGNTKQIQYFDKALNSEDLETLTSWVSFTDMAESQLYSIQ